MRGSEPSQGCLPQRVTCAQLRYELIGTFFLQNIAVPSAVGPKYVGKDAVLRPLVLIQPQRPSHHSQEKDVLADCITCGAAMLAGSLT